MEGGAVTTSSFLYHLINCDGHKPKDALEHESAPINDLLQNCILPKENNCKTCYDDDIIHYATPVYATSVETTQTYLSNRTKSLQEAKNAFLCSTITANGRPPLAKKHEPKLTSTIQYAEITVRNKSEDSRITGGGIKEDKDGNSTKNMNSNYSKIMEKTPFNKKHIEVQTRKVSFKIKNNSTLHKRTALAGKTTITSNKVADLTRKFNQIVQEKDHKFAKTIEKKIQNLSRSNSSTPSSTLSSSASIRIIVRQKKSNKNRLRKKCSSVDAIDKIVCKGSPLLKRKVLRTKSDGNRKNKSPRKKLHYPETKSSIDTVDGFPQSLLCNENVISECNTVQNAIKKIESEISATSNTLIKDKLKSNIPNVEATVKPKIPEKKSSLFVTKNVVLKDGVPKIKTLKQTTMDENVNEIQKLTVEAKTQKKCALKNKDLINDRRKYKTSIIHRSKLSLQAVEIIHEDILDNTVTEDRLCFKVADEENRYQDIAAGITPNESFLWRRKSSCLSNSDLDSTSESNLYSPIHDQKSKSLNEMNKIDLFKNEAKNKTLGYDFSETSSVSESRMYMESNNSDTTNIPESEKKVFEALNNEVILNNLSKRTVAIPDDDYETFETVNEAILEVTIPVKTNMECQLSKINCPLPEIPIEPPCHDLHLKDNVQENIYHCLLETRSHPEGDESSIHSYELCTNELEERTRGDGDSDDGYELCNPPPSHNTSGTINRQLTEPKPLPSPPKESATNYEISKSVSTASTISYEKIGGDAIYERIPCGPPKSKYFDDMQPGTRDSIVSSEYNDGENIYDTIKPPDGTSLSNCYESIPNSPSTVKLRNNFHKQLASVVHKRMSFDSMSNVSQSTLSSEQKTNSIYGQRSMISFTGQEIAFKVPNSDTSASDRSDRSDDWVDMSEPEGDIAEDSRIIIVHERSRGRKSPVSWSQKVRHQWHKSPKQTKHNDGESSDSGHHYESFEAVEAGAAGATGGRAAGASGATGGRAPRVPAPYDIDFDSFDSDSDAEQAAHPAHAGKSDRATAELEHARLPDPPPPPPPAPGGVYTLTKFASVARKVAGKKMRELTRNFTRRHSDYDKSYQKTSPSSGGHSEKESKQKSKSMIYENCEKMQQDSRLYSNIPSPEQKTYAPLLNNKTENPLMRINGNAFNNELKERLNEKRLSACYGEDPPPLPEKPSTPASPGDRAKGKGEGKDSGTFSRKNYFSLKSKFKRASSMVIDINSDVPSALKITNSTFYLTDSMDGDSGFSNCSDNAPTNGGSAETLQPVAPARKNRADSGTDRLSLNPKPHPKYESSPNLTVTEERHRMQRPDAPPPPPPPTTATDLTAVNQELKRLLPSLSKKDKSPRTRTSWYAECGQLDLEPRNVGPVAGKDRPTSSSWYAEAGLYQAGDISSSSSGASCGSHPASPLPHHSLFTHEPLYQFYNAAKVESVCRENVADSDSDGYEAVSEIKKKVEQEFGRTSAMSLVSPLRGPSRTLWCEIPEVLNSPVLNALTPSQKRLQEAKFELITSEASYLNSLSVLESHFIGHPAFRDEAALSGTDREILFGTITPVRKCSQLFMNELEKCWQDNILLHGLCDVVKKNAQKHFGVYIKYCENQIFLVKTLQRLKAKVQFQELLARLESHPACQCLSLHSFLMLPMQRVTRLPLLMDAVLRNLDPADDEYQTCMDTLATLNSFVSQCNEGARNMERVEEMYRLAAQIEFPAHMRRAPELAPACSRADGGTAPLRWLVRSGELVQLVWRADEQLRLTFGKKFQKVPLHLFLFNDLLVITKKRSEEWYTVVDYCQRSLIEISSGDVLTQLNLKETSGKHVMLLTLLENHESKTVEMLMSCASETDASRWLEAMVPPEGEEGECVYTDWDCPQAAAVYAYAPAQPDELALLEGDIVNVTRKMPEGWYYGERIRDGEMGWFPGSYTAEIPSQHVRARNLRQRYRLLALSGSYLGQRRKP